MGLFILPRMTRPHPDATTHLDPRQVCESARKRLGHLGDHVQQMLGAFGTG